MNIIGRIQRAINASSFKEIWEAEDRALLFQLTNEIRIALDLPPYTPRKLDEGFQYRTVFHEDFTVAKEELLNLVFGWW
jgi:hypothetical protein